MHRTIVSVVVVGSALSLEPGARARAAFDPPKVNLIMQNTRTSPWAVVQRVTVAQQSTRRIRLSGPWVGFTTSVTTKNGVSGRNFTKVTDNQIELILDASTTAPRGDMTLTLNIKCPVIPFDCRGSTTFPVKVFESGPITSIQPHGNVPANTKVTFDLTGEALDVAILLPRLLSLKSASVVSKTATTMKVVGVTPACGYVDVALTDMADGDESPYRHGPATQAVLAGTICGQSLAPPLLSTTSCTSPQVWDATLKACKNP